MKPRATKSTLEFLNESGVKFRRTRPKFRAVPYLEVLLRLITRRKPK